MLNTNPSMPHAESQPDVRQPAAQPAQEGVLVDAHVHFYSAYDTRRFLDEATAGFAAQPHTRAQRMLCMAESSSDNWFADVAGNTGLLDGTGWTASPTEEPACIALERTADGAALFLIAGHQCVTAEDIEVLMLGQCEKHPDGEPAEKVVAAALDAGALPLLPWGFGKWLGARGTLVRNLMSTYGNRVLLGDNSGRLGGTPLPGLLREGAASGHCLLPGSDPLPMQGEEHKVASFGAYLPGSLSTATPFSSLKTLVQSGAAPQPYGDGETLLRFVRNQLLMQVRKRRSSNA